MIESLEPRTVLAGHMIAGADPDPGGPAPFDSVPDSPLGDDIHQGGLDDSATELFFDLDVVEIHSHIDRDADSDVFRFVAPSKLLIIGVNGEVPLIVQLHDAEGQMIIDTAALSGDVEPGEMLPLVDVATRPGQQYFLSVGSTKGQRGEYQLQLHAPLNVDPIGPNPPHDPGLHPDAVIGDDIHVDVRGPDATRVEFDSSGLMRVSSHLDSGQDTDYFQFVGRAGRVLGEGGGVTEELDFDFSLIDADGNVLSTANSGYSVEAVIDQGRTYFLAVSSASATVGQYVFDLYFENDESSIDPVEPAHPSDPVVDVTDPLDEDSRQPVKLTADVDGDETVGFRDFLVLAANYGDEVDVVFADGDINRDGHIDMQDFLLLAAEFGQRSSPSAT
jgi:hypothetical protein